MSPDFRKAALIAATLGLLVSLFFALRPDDDEEADAGGTTATTPTLTAPATIGTAPATEALETEPPPATTETQPATTAPPSTDEPVTIRIAVPGDTAPSVREFSVRRGREVVLVVRSDLSDHVHLHGYDLMADVGPGQPARIEFTADATGLFEIELEDRRLRIANLEVRP